MTDTPADPDAQTLARRYRAVLDAEMAQLVQASEDSGAARQTVELDQQSVGRLSRMDALQGQAMAAALEVRRRGRRARIVAALHRMETGEFGYCVDCGGFIGLPRLDVDPTAARCGDCKG
ncbi:TraR/DksA C4-type zinc finger protein [Dinoroseobacter sp. PD6]|uniref:TraR/DksA family transcriptional regulator n=1 Tax=Dinoroseobacter sp. PD6 TaxID=3028384 RepID=UPI00237A42E4|nr:TraR/DksA C4-type zinc finger protein [Dinoroseobacter sp. PD6]MDD9716365.1 TraR/DksA C4-type zinc finger protein [Dinoroseobacter sp. PD6]